MNPRYKAEAKRIKKAKVEARQKNLELLTPLATAQLFGKSPEAVRKAIRVGHLLVAVSLSFTDKHVGLIRLSSAIEHWGEPDEEALDQMRENGLTLGDINVTYNVLHPKPLHTLSEPLELE